MLTMWPVEGPVTQRFGANPASWQPDGHTGMDFGVPIGTPVRAPADGVVLYEGWATALGWPNRYYLAIDFDGPDNGDQSGGIVLIIDHGDFVTIMGHLSQTGINVGDRVTRGEIVAQTGNTGFSTGPHLHLEVLPNNWNVLARWYGRVNPELYIGKAVELLPAERLVANGRTASGRTQPRGTGDLVRTAPSGAREIFDGWINGEVVNGNGIWYHDTTPAWYWSGNFEDSSTNGLPDMNVVIVPGGEVSEPVLGNQRVTAADGAQRRSAPNKNAAAVGERFPGDKILTFRGFVHGETPYPNTTDVWFVGAFGEPTYFWAGSFEDEGVHDLPDLTADLFPSTPQDPVTPPVIEVPYDFDLDFLTVNGIAVEKFPAHLSNIEKGRFPAAPPTAVCHWWNRLEVHPAITSVVGEFQRKDSFKSAHFVVSDDRILQMVSLKDRAYHAGAVGNDWVGIEINPAAIERDGDGVYTARALRVQANVRELLIQLRTKYGYKLATILHKNVPGNSTACSDLDLSTFEVPAPTPTPIPSPYADDIRVLLDFQKFIGEFVARLGESA